MKSPRLSSPIAALALLALMSLVALSCVGVAEARGNLVRGLHKPKGLKHYSMGHERMLETTVFKKDDEDEKDEDNKNEDDEDDKEEDEKEEVEAAEEETEEPTEEPDETDTDEPEETDTEAPSVDMGMPDLNLSIPEGVTPDAEGTNGTVIVMPGEMFMVPLEPFSLTVDGTITEDDMQLETYLENYMKTFMPNLVAVELESKTYVDGQPVTDSQDDGMEDDTSNSTRKLRLHHAAVATSHRSLAVQTFYYEGNATFEGPPMRTVEEVDAALTYALEDTAALQTHLEKAGAGANVTVTTTPSDPVPDGTDPNGVQAEESEQEKSEESGLSTTGLSIVIVAACVGGISLLIILLVGLSGPSGNTSGMKGGLPEQPLQ